MRAQNLVWRLAWLFALPVLAFADVPIDHVPSTLTLPSSYPDSWVLVYSVQQPISGTYAIVDVAAETKEYKGQFQGAFYPSIVDPVASKELYIAESFFQRVTHGTRDDVLTVMDKATLTPTAEITLPGTERAIVAGNLLELTNDGELILLLNFTPASSVTVIDRKQRKVLNEVPIPGCTSIYPNGPRGFASFCANGTLASFVLGKGGQVLHEHRSEPFNDIDHDVLYLQPTSIGTLTYFISAQGHVREIDLTGEAALPRATWALMTEEESADGWHTADGTFEAADAAGRLYVRLYRETGYAKQLADNTEVWVYDVTSHQRVQRIPLKNGGTSIDVTRGKRPYLVVAADSVAGSLDVYDAQTSVWVRSIGGWSQPLYLVQGKR